MSQHFQRECERFLDDITCKIKKDRKEFKHLICPITDQIMIDPVIASDRKTYERCAIAGAYQRGDTDQPLTERCPNYMAKDMIAAYKRGTVYLLQPQKYIGTYVLKLGDSKHIDLTREKQYGKNTDIIYHVQCDYYWLVEKALKDEFNRHFECVKIEKNGKMLPTKEYFRGNLQDMQDCWISVVSNIMRRHRSLDKQINDKVYPSRESEPVVAGLVVDSSGDDDTSMGPEYAMNNVGSRLNLQQTMRQQFNSSSDGDTPDNTSETPLSDSPNDSDTPVVLRETTLTGQKRPVQTSSAFSRESSADNKRRRRKTIPMPLTTEQNEVFEEWCSTWHIAKGSKIKTHDLRNNHPNSYNNYCEKAGTFPMKRMQFMAAMAALGHTPGYLHEKGNGVGFFDIAFVDKDCPRPRRHCRNSEDFSENGQNLSKRLSLDKIDVETAKTYFSTWKKKHGLVHDSTKEKSGRKTRPKYYEKCATVWNSYQKFSAEIFEKHRFNKNTFQTMMEERGFCRVRSQQGSPCGYAGSDWYYTNLKRTGKPLQQTN